ncbi:MAG TPA: ArsA-related P-loop ATPase, partial [Solirubrobacteraceae bacterium]|nr:ArsA-related P-loop ATPase [Solirubrobacteraceae bacterium]
GLLSRRLGFVVGKGGVGRSTVSAALGLLAARRGQRTIVAEVSGRGELAQLFGVVAEQGEVEVAPRLWAIQIDTERSLDEYLHEHLPLRMLADLVGATRLIGYLAAATPGLRELLNVGKLWELAQPERRVPDVSPYDLVVVDAPASGHSLALLTAPQAFARTAQGGPIARQGGRINAFLHDPANTGVLAVARPEDAAVSELLELGEQLRRDGGMPLDLVVVNAASDERLDEADANALRRVIGRPGDLPAGARIAVERALTGDLEARLEREQIDRVAAALPAVALVELRRCYDGELGLAALEALAEQLEAVL